MKNTILLVVTAFILFGCNGNSQEKKEKKMLPKKAAVDLLTGSSPAAFSATTVDGTAFSSKDYTGKYWVIFVYTNSSLAKTETHDLVTELNTTYQKYGSKVPMIGIVNGFTDNEAVTKKDLLNAKIPFKQIDNTQGPDKEKRVDENVFCYTAKILIDPKGKVVYNGCGGGTETFNEKLDSLIKAEKL